MLDEMEDLVKAFQGLSLADMAEEEAPIEEGGAGGLEWEACGLGPGSTGVPVGGAEVEVTGFRVAEPSCTELAQAVEALLRGLQAVLLDIHAGRMLKWSRVHDDFVQ